MIIKQKNITFSINIKSIRKYTLLLVLSIFLMKPGVSFSQEKNMSSVAETIIINGDTLAHYDLPEVIVIPAYKFTSKKQKKKYNRLAKRLKKVYPYAKMANETLIKITEEIDSIDNKRIAKKHIKEVDKALQERYGKELKKLTISEGRLLIKLIDRETGSTSYELVKELRGSFSAFMWQSLARLFGENLKVSYSPQEEDKMIEHILILIENDQL